MPYAGPTTYAGAAPFAGSTAAPAATPPEPSAGPIAGPFAGPRPFAGPAPFAGAPRIAGGEPPPATVVVSTDSASASDGFKAQAGGSFGLFDAFTDGYGTPLESHTPTGGSGSWSKHPSYSSGSLSIGGYGGNRLVRNNTGAATSAYMTDRSATDARATWTTGDHEVVYANDRRVGVGLRVAPSADTGYFAVADNDETTGIAEWQIVKRVAGVETLLAAASKTWLQLTPVSLDFGVVGAALTLRVNGSIVAAASDSSISGPGRFAVLFRPMGVPEGAGSWIDDLWTGDVGAGSKLAPERVWAGVGGAEPIGLASSHRLIASLVVFAGVDAASATEGARVYAGVAGTPEAVGSAESRWALGSARSADSAGWGRSDASSVSVLVQAAEVAGADSAGADEAGAVGAVIAAAEAVSSLDAQVVLASISLVALAGVDEGRAGEAASVAAMLSSGEAASWGDRAAIRAGIWASESVGADSAWATRSILATLTYSIYGNNEEGGPIDYGVALATTTETHWPTSPLAVPGVYRFAVRAQTALGGEEKNLDAEVVIRLDATGVDITAIPGPPTALGAASIKGGAIRVTWAAPANASDRATAPAGYRVYAAGAPGPLTYTSPAATVPAGPTRSGTYAATLAGLIDGTSYLIGVRSYNDAGEEANTTTVVAVSDATGPSPVLNLTISTDPEDWS